MAGWWDYPDNRALDRKLDTVLAQLNAVSRKVDSIMVTQDEVRAVLTKMTADVAGEKDAIVAMETLLGNIGKLIADLKDKVANAPVPQDIKDSVDALNKAVNENKDRILKDVTDNTPLAG